MSLHRLLHFLIIALSVFIATFAQARDDHPAHFVDATMVVPDLVLEMRYATAHNFVSKPIDGYERPVCLLTAEAAHALALVQADLKSSGLGLKVFDCYRPQRAVAHFVRWAKDRADIAGKSEFYPDVDKRYLFALGYIAQRSGHSRGSTVDLTLVHRADGSELDMGTGFDLFSTKSWLSDKSVSAQAQRNRAMLATAMRRRGFASYAKEWWHFSLRGEPFPDRYFDFPVR